MAKWPLVSVVWYVRIATKQFAPTEGDRDRSLGSKPSAEVHLDTVASHHTTPFMPRWNYVYDLAYNNRAVKAIRDRSEPGTRVAIQIQWRLRTRWNPGYKPHTLRTHEYKVVNNDLKRVWLHNERWWA